MIIMKIIYGYLFVSTIVVMLDFHRILPKFREEAKDHPLVGNIPDWFLFLSITLFSWMIFPILVVNFIVKWYIRFRKFMIKAGAYIWMARLIFRYRWKGFRQGRHWKQVIMEDYFKLRMKEGDKWTYKNLGKY